MSAQDYVGGWLFTLTVSAAICVILDLIGSPIDTFSLIAGTSILTIGMALVSHGRNNLKFCHNEEKFLLMYFRQSTDAQWKMALGVEDTRKLIETGINEHHSIGSLHMVEIIGGVACCFIGLLWLVAIFG